MTQIHSAGGSVQHFPSFWGQKDQEYMIIILLHILPSDVNQEKKLKFYSTLGKIWLGNSENWQKIK
jgi:hypothetical protein